MADEQKNLNQGDENPEKRGESSNNKKRRRKPRSEIDATKKVTGRELSEFKDSISKREKNLKKDENDNRIDKVSPLNAPKKKKRRRRKKKPKSAESSNLQVKPVEANENKKNKPADFSDQEESKSPELVYQYTQPEQPAQEDSIQVFPLAGNAGSDRNEKKSEVDSSVTEPEGLPAEDKKNEDLKQMDEPEQIEKPVQNEQPETPEETEQVNPEPIEEPEVTNDDFQGDRLGPEDIQVAPHGMEGQNELDQAYAPSAPPEQTDQNGEQENWVDLMKKHQEPDQQTAPLDKNEIEKKEDKKEFEQPEVIVGAEDAEVADVRVDEKPKELDEKDSDAASKVEFEGQVEEEKYPSDINFIGEKSSILDVLKRVGNTVLRIIGSVFNFKVIFGLLVVALLAGGGYWLFGGNVLGGFDNWFGGGPADNGVTVSDEDLYSENGFLGASIFGENKGSMKDLIPVQVRIADYFGRLQEPRDQGETGISAATYYGELMDEREIINMFVDYVDTLERMQNLYQVDVYELLDKTTDREEALKQYLNDLKTILDEGRSSLDAIQLNKDDLSQSYNSLSPDKQQFEDDFFASLENLEAEKSDVLLKSFVDASQKQVALKARVAALDRLSEYYDNALAKVERRISAIEQNMEALSRGIRVVDVPGAGIDLIIREE